MPGEFDEALFAHGSAKPTVQIASDSTVGGIDFTFDYGVNRIKLLIPEPGIALLLVNCVLGRALLAAKHRG